MRSGSPFALLARLRAAPWLFALAPAALILTGASPAGAVSTIYGCATGVTCYFGEDIGDGSVPDPNDLGDFPDSRATETAFQGVFGGQFNTESFETFADKASGMLSIFQSGSILITGTLSDTVPDAGVVRVAPLDNAADRGFPTAGTNFWKNETVYSTSAQLFNVGFSADVRAFGFFATAYSTDESPTATPATALVLDLWADEMRTVLLQSIAIPHNPMDDPGSVFYFGVIADVPFRGVSVRNDSLSDPGDRIGFDDFTVAIVPEPSTGLLLFAGLLGLAALGRRASRLA